MKIDKNNIIGSVLEIRPTGIDVSQDLTQPDGKSIAELLNNEENQQNKKNKK
jgi:hypothetical protein